jgi:hypothetical protein
MDLKSMILFLMLGSWIFIQRCWELVSIVMWRFTLTKNCKQERIQWLQFGVRLVKEHWRRWLLDSKYSYFLVYGLKVLNTGKERLISIMALYVRVENQFVESKALSSFEITPFPPLCLLYLSMIFLFRQFFSFICLQGRIELLFFFSPIWAPARISSEDGYVSYI